MAKCIAWKQMVLDSSDSLCTLGQILFSFLNPSLPTLKGFEIDFRSKKLNPDC